MNKLKNISNGTLYGLLFWLLLLLSPFITHAQWGSVNVRFDPATATQFSTPTSTTPLTYSCVIGQQLKSLSLWTRAGSGSRTLVLNVDGIDKGTTTITTTQAYSNYTNINTPCLDGSYDIKFKVSGSTYYLYATQLSNSNTDYLLKYIQTGIDYSTEYYATFDLPITIASSTDMGTSTTIFIPNNEFTILFSVLNGLLLVFIILFVWKIS